MAAEAEALSSAWIRVSLSAPHVLLVELNRAPVNAFNDDFWIAYGQVFDRIGRGEGGDVRVVVLASALPKLFTAGLDLNAAGSTFISSAPDPARRALELHTHVLTFQNAISAPERARVPVVVAMHGLVYGLGVDIALACDVRYAAADAIFAIKEVDIGLASDIGTLARLRHSVPASAAHELAYSARTFDAAEAARLGLVSRVVPGSFTEVRSAALALANEIASKSPVAVAATKKLLLHARDHSVAENLEFTAAWNAAMLQARDTTDAIVAFKTKKAPVFAPLSTPSKPVDLKETAKL